MLKKGYTDKRDRGTFIMPDLLWHETSAIFVVTDRLSHLLQHTRVLGSYTNPFIFCFLWYVQ